jgi:hypothetical protein
MSFQEEQACPKKENSIQMSDEVLVGPNTTFGRAVALLAVVVVGVLAYLWRFPSPRPDEATA